MKRRTLDIIFAGGGAVLAVLILVLGWVLADQAAFAEDYVKQQLSEQKIVFSSQEALDKDEATPANTANIAKVTEWREGSTCLEKYAGTALDSGKKAECYGNFYIGMHMARSAANMAAQYNEPLFNGATYATLGGDGELRTKLNAQINPLKEQQTAAKAANDQAKVDELQKQIDPIQKQIDSVTSLRSTMQTGETLRGLLLTSYGFSIFGEKAALAATVCYIIGGLLIVLAIAGFVHAFITPKEKVAFSATAPSSTATRPSGAK
ncbi:MAG: hypothetical protein IT303_07130 [Dehalococcoidia bacterium]|nr:hypothetical protein [Dehalococcoidia bacterium]